MRILKYSENANDYTVSIKVQYTPKEFEANDVRNIRVDELRHQAKSRLLSEDIQNLIYDYFDVSEELREAMKRPETCNRIAKWVEVRRFQYYFLRKYTMMTLSQIGGLYGQGHANVLHHIKKIDGWLEINCEMTEPIVWDLSLAIDKLNEIKINEL